MLCLCTLKSFNHDPWRMYVLCSHDVLPLFLIPFATWDAMRWDDGKRVRKYYVMVGIWSNRWIHFVLVFFYSSSTFCTSCAKPYNYHYLRHMHVQLIQMCGNFNVNALQHSQSYYLPFILIGSSHHEWVSFRHIDHYRMWNESPLWVYARYVFNTMNITIMVL